MQQLALIAFMTLSFEKVNTRKSHLTDFRAKLRKGTLDPLSGGGGFATFSPRGHLKN